MRLLIIEDDDSLAAGMAGSLRRPGMAVDVARSGEQADGMLRAENFDLAVLDIGLPRMDGFEVLRRLRARGQTVPVLILTARDEVDDRVRGLDLGADDYMVKPFEFREFEARVRALLRRGAGQGSPMLALGPVRLDRLAQRAWIHDTPLELRGREWAVLEVLLAHAGHVMSKERILQGISTWTDDISPNAVEVYISRLRGKLEPAGLTIRSIRGFGYLLQEPPDERT